jgi:molybdopterin-guanine dinucleotide biosynthesis protein A
MGGQARRFAGRDKSTMMVGGRPIVERQLAALRSVTDDLMLVGSREPGPPGVRAVADRVPNQGPLAGLDAALGAARDEVLVLVACDMPFVTGLLFAHMLTRIDGADAVVPRTERGYHPLCAAYARSCREPVNRRLRDGRLRMLDLLDDLRVYVVEGDELGPLGGQQLLANVNTPDELRDLEALLDHEQ